VGVLEELAGFEDEFTTAPQEAKVTNRILAAASDDKVRVFLFIYFLYLYLMSELRNQFGLR
jgi:hypothetical protein